MDCKNLSVDYRKEFKLNKYGFLEGQRQKEQYRAYQNEYRQMYGTYPELDLVNKPYYAIWNDVDEMYNECLHKSVGSALAYADKCSAFKKKFKRIFSKYEKETSFCATIAAKDGEFIRQIKEMKECFQVQDNVGYLKDADGNYYEGTWKDGNLIYGLYFSEKQQHFYIGSFSNGFDGLNFCVLSDATAVGMYYGTQILVDGTYRLHSDEILIYGGNYKSDTSGVLIGKYVYGYEEGKFVGKNLGDGSVLCLKFHEGEIVAPSALAAFLIMLIRGYCSIFVLLFYFAYYFELFPLHPIRRAIITSKKRKAGKNRVVQNIK